MDVADDVQAGVTGGHSQVVRMVARVFFVDDVVQYVADGVDFIGIGTQGIHVDVEVHLVAVLQFIFQDIEGGVDIGQVSRVRDFGVNRAEQPSRAVVVDADVVDADDVLAL